MEEVSFRGMHTEQPHFYSLQVQGKLVYEDQRKVITPGAGRVVQWIKPLSVVTTPRVSVCVPAVPLTILERQWKVAQVLGPLPRSWVT